MNRPPMLVVALLLAGTMAIAQPGETHMNVKQPPLNTTMMGVLKAAADYHGLTLSAPMIYGLSGHAFVINIHNELCPSGPYCWKRENAQPLIENIGIRMIDLGFFGPGATPEDRAEVEGILRRALDAGIPCSLINLENQIISGYDKTGFVSAQPWAPHHKFPPARLSFGSWQEFGKEFHVNFYTLEKVDATNRHDAVLASLDYAVDMWTQPDQHSADAHGAGPNAYVAWIKAVPECGARHGNWWNATVWSECRRMAADYVSAIADDNASVAEICIQLRSDYQTIAENLAKVSNKKLAPEPKIALLRETKQLEAEAIARIKTLTATLRSNR